uniref:Uncharacterized protein n=1 Tax=uncultured bacterium A1Q1_fos_2386 TaxID=1256568 RepID=L7VRP1_9BACT|nr:hypothetical protein [uncultured bacterium A1Q1_fos_2386]
MPRISVQLFYDAAQISFAKKAMGRLHIKAAFDMHISFADASTQTTLQVARHCEGCPCKLQARHNRL